MRKLALVLTLALLSVSAAAQNLDWKSSTHYKKADAKAQLIERFNKYVTFDTQADHKAGKVPSTAGQLKLAKELAKELKKYGAQNVKVDKYGIVTAEIEANSKRKSPVIGFLAHLDTGEEISGKDVVPQVHKNYKGGDIVINAQKNIAINPENSPQLARAYGHDIITASGGTLLGADDKAGIAILMTAVEYLDKHPELAHGTVKIAFTPDEEIGAGIEKFDIPAFGAQYAYTLDGGEMGALTDETFNARKFNIIFTGNRAVHPGYAMNSPFTDNILMASDFHTLLPRISRPETTSGRKGYIYVDNISTQGDRTEITGIIRAFTDEETEQLTAQLQQAFKTTKALYPRAQAQIDVQDEYKNMKTALPAQVVTLATQAMKAEDISPVLRAARGGTDGAVLSLAGLPTPDIFAGQFNIHSEREYADADVMEASLRTVLRLISLWDLQEITGN